MTDFLHRTRALFGEQALVSIAEQAGLLLASEVIAYILKDTECLEREVVFASSFVAVDLLNMKMQVKSLSNMGC